MRPAFEDNVSTIREVVHDLVRGSVGENSLKVGNGCDCLFIRVLKIAD